MVIVTRNTCAKLSNGFEKLNLEENANENALRKTISSNHFPIFDFGVSVSGAKLPKNETKNETNTKLMSQCLK